jgi:hypothetical protein
MLSAVRLTGVPGPLSLTYPCAMQAASMGSAAEDDSRGSGCAGSVPSDTASSEQAHRRHAGDCTAQSPASHFSRRHLLSAANVWTTYLLLPSVWRKSRALPSNSACSCNMSVRRIETVLADCSSFGWLETCMCVNPCRSHASRIQPSTGASCKRA